MNKSLTFLLAALLTTASASVSTVLPASADSYSNLDCTQAEAMLEQAVKTRIPTLLPGDIDKDFSTIMQVHERVGMRIYQIEAKCGKDPKMQAMAAKQSDIEQQRMAEFGHMNSSQ